MSLIRALPVAVVAMIGLAACSSEHNVVYRNATTFEVTVFSDGYEVATVGPGDTGDYRTRKNLMPDHLQVYDPNGRLVLDEVLTWEILEERNFEIVISEPGTQ